MVKKKVFVTGVTSGIGRAIAQSYLEEGFEVMGVGRRPQCDLKGVRYFQVDLSDLQAVREFVKKESLWLGELDILVNNAGLALGLKHFHEQTQEEVEKVLLTNVFSVFELTRLLLPKMIQRRSGFVVNLGSIAGKEVYENGTLYCASKAAIEAFTTGLKRDLTGTGVRVFHIAPGKVRTQFSEVRFYGDMTKANKAYEGYRPIEPKDIADIVVWVTERPPHVEITDLTVLATDQVDAVKVRNA